MRRWRLAAAAGLALAAVVAGIVIASSGGGAPRPPAPGASGEAFGVNVNYLFNTHAFSAARIAVALSAVRATGATVARTDALWEASEPLAPTGGVHHWNWSFDDEIAGALASHGLRWLAILDYSASWAQSIPGQDHSPPARDSDFVAYAAAFAARYGSGGTFWQAHPSWADEAVTAFEIWNEPDNAQFWLPKPDPAAYAALYLAARKAIRQVDPDARVLIGGLAHPVSTLPSMALAQPALPREADGIAIHPYGADPVAVLDEVAQARAAARTSGMGSVPLYVTEFGWATSPPDARNYAPASLRPGYIEQAIDDLGHTGCNLASAILYTWVTPERDPANREDWYGIATPQGTASADTRALAAGIQAADEPGRVVRSC